MTALVTGACGFCGQHLGDRLAAEEGVRSVGLDRSAPAATPVGFKECVVGDLEDGRFVEEVIRRVQPRWVFHLAGLVRGADPEIYRANVLGAINLLEAIRTQAPDARVLLVGSAAEYGAVSAADLPIREEYRGRPEGAYGLSKYCGTLAGLDYARRYGLRVVVARPFNIIGAGVPPGLIVGAIIQRALTALRGPEPRVVKVGNLDTQRDFVAVEDVVDAYWRLLQGGAWGEVFNISSGEPHTIRSVVEVLLEHAGGGLRLEVDPALMRPSDVPVAYGSNRKIAATIGFKPQRTLADALRAAWDDAKKAAGRQGPK